MKSKRMRMITVAVAAVVLTLSVLLICASADAWDGYLFEADFEQFDLDAPLFGLESSETFGKCNQNLPSLATFASDPTGTENTVIKLPMAAAGTTSDNSAPMDIPTEIISGGGNVDRNISMANPRLPYQLYGNVVFEVSYYIPADAQGSVQSQFYSITHARGSAGWVHLYYLNLSDATLLSNGGKISMKKDVWNTVSVVLNLESGVAELYFNNVYEHSFDLGYEDITLKANTWIVAKINKDGSGDPAALQKELYIDKAQIHVLQSGEIQVYNQPNDSGAPALYSTFTTAMGREMTASAGKKILTVPGVILPEVHYLDGSMHDGLIRNVAGAEFRYSDMGGIRFLTEINTQKLAALEDLIGQGVVKRVELGTLIVPLDYVQRAGGLTFERLGDAGLSYLDVKVEMGSWYDGDETAPDPGETRLFAGSIYSIKVSNRSRDFAATGYVRLLLTDGTRIHLYADGDPCSESVQALAIKEASDTVVYDSLSPIERELLEHYCEGKRAFDLDSPVIKGAYCSVYEFFFQTGEGVSCRLTYDGNDGWRLQAVKPKEEAHPYDDFDDMGAGQTLAMYLGEPHDDVTVPLDVSVADGKLLIKARGSDSYVTLEYRLVFHIRFHSGDGTVRANLSGISADEGSVTLTGYLTEREGVFGGGQKFDSINQRGKRISLYTYDAYNTDGGKGSYVAIPLFLTTRGAGIFVNRYEGMTADLGKTQSNQWQICIDNDLMDCYFYATGKMTDVLGRYTDLTGATALPEEWAQGVMICRYSPDLQSVEGHGVEYSSLEEIPLYEELYIDKALSQPATAVEKWLNNTYLYHGNGAKYRYHDGIFYRIYAKGHPAGYGVRDVVENLIAAGMRPTAVIMEGANIGNVTNGSVTANENFKKLKGMIDWLHERDIKAMFYMGVAGCSYEMPGWREEYMAHAYVTTYDESGNVLDVTWTKHIPRCDYRDNPDALGSNTQQYIDITNPEAVDWYMNTAWHYLIELGVDGVKIDFCETMPNEGFDATGRTYIEYDLYDETIIPPDEIHHAYSTYFISMFYKKMNEMKEALGMEGGFTVLSRGGGIGSQRNPYMWAGDQYRNFSNMKKQLSAILSSGMSGIPFMTTDMAGYVYGTNGGYWGGNDSGSALVTEGSRENLRNNPAAVARYESEIYIRSIQYTAFTTNIQTHGEVRQPYQMTEQAKEIIAAYVTLHEKLLPYFQKLSALAAETGIPVARHLVLQYQDDKNVYGIEDEFMLGDGVLVAPILEWSGTYYRTETEITKRSSRAVYLPRGNWVDLNSGAVYSLKEGTWISTTVTIEQIPVFLNLDSEDALMLGEIFNSDFWQALNGGNRISVETE
ncbi:MAG: glycoside hydrolase family 31 protein [Clostridia bacterium]|nr:glycoside hydrolase family 31 protein [Clostridia bacterium]